MSTFDIRIIKHSFENFKYNTGAKVTCLYLVLFLHDIVDSISPAAIAQSAVGTTECSQDYIEVSKIKLYKNVG